MRAIINEQQIYKEIGNDNIFTLDFSSETLAKSLLTKIKLLTFSRNSHARIG